MSAEPSNSALRMVHQYVSPTAGLVERIVAVRSPVALVRHTRYRVPVVDESLLTGVFPFVPAAARLIVVIMIEGSLSLRGNRTFKVEPGEAAMLRGTDMALARFESAEYIDVEWMPTSGSSAHTPSMLRAPSVGRVRTLLQALEAVDASPTKTLREGTSLARDLGAPAPSLLRKDFVAPSQRDVQVARAMEEQLLHLRDRATTIHLSDVASRSPRQMQRIVSDFNRRYGLNAGSWRDTRNRWRIQTAILLLSIPEFTVAAVAAEVGYASPNALARGFAQVGFPSPAAVREMLRGPA